MRDTCAYSYDVSQAILRAFLSSVQCGFWCSFSSITSLPIDLLNVLSTYLEALSAAKRSHLPR